MHLKPHYIRYLYIGAFVVVLLSAVAGGWTWMRFASQKTVVHQLVTPASYATATQAAALHFSSGQNAPTSTVSIHADAAVHLLIPKIGVDAPIEMVGLDSGGRMEVPTKNQWNDVGWYRNGALPGALGSAVIDGHLDTNTGAPAVFWKLSALRVGDMITVKDNAGRKVQFRVFKLQSYNVDHAPLDQIFSKKDGVYLNLITCAGSWDYAQNQFQQRLVVFTRLA